MLMTINPFSLSCIPLLVVVCRVSRYSYVVLFVVVPYSLFCFITTVMLSFCANNFRDKKYCVKIFLYDLRK